MAKIFRTEELSVNGDNIRLAADNDGNLVIKDSNSNVVTSTDIIASDVSSLAVKDVATSSDISSLQFKDLDLDSDISSLVAKDGNVDSDISSLQAQRVSDEAETDSDISSLQAQRVSDEALTDSDVSSLAFKDLDLDSDVSSLAALAAKNDVVVAEKQIWSTGDAVSSVTIDLGREFSTTPKVVGVLMTSVDTDPIIGFMLKSVDGGSGSNHTATFVFSDDIASTSYKMQVLASI